MKDKSIGKRLASVQKEKGLTTSEIAHALDIAPYNWRRYINGERTPSNKLVLDFSKIYKANIMDLLFGYGNLFDSGELEKYLSKQNREDLYALIVSHTETSELYAFRKKCGISHKKFRLLVKDYWMNISEEKNIGEDNDKTKC